MHGAAYKNVAEAVRYLASHGAKPEVWNQPNKQGWTPLTIAQVTGSAISSLHRLPSSHSLK
jgi:ankyrin repeat protein